MRLRTAGLATTVGIALFLFVLGGCSKSNDPVQPQANKQPDYQFMNVLPYSGLNMGEVAETVAPNPNQVDRLRAPVSELSSALVRDYESDEVELSNGLEKYNRYLGRINPSLSPGQQEAFGKLLGYHVDLIHFGKDLRFFLRALARALELTPVQVEQVKGCAKTYGEGARNVFKHVKDGTLTRDEARQQIQGLFEQFVNCFKSALTAEQLERLRGFLQHEHGH